MRRQKLQLKRGNAGRGASLLLLTALGCATAAGPGPEAGTASSATSVPAAPEQAALRVVLVTIDTLRADFVGCYGSRLAKTRTLDRLAREGTRFETAIAPTPVTLPSHTSILTGLDPPRHGVHSNGKFVLGEGIPTLAESFQRAGFATSAFLGAAVLDRRYGLARGFDLYDDEMGFRRNVAGSSSYAERTAGEVLDRVLPWVREAPERFFLWVHLYDPHANYDPPRGFVKKSSQPPPDPEKVGFLNAAARALPPLYAGEIYYTDTELGALLRLLEQRFPDGRTLVVVTSDHGESLGAHGELTHSLTLYDATQRVPLILSGAGVPPGRVVEAPVRLVDVAPTVLALSGLPPLGDTDGQDLRPWLSRARRDGLDAYVETLVTRLDYGWSPVLGIRSERYKYLRTTRPELYDLVADPFETNNLASSRSEVAAELDARLEARLRDARPLEPRAVPAEERDLLESLGYLVSSDSGPLPALGSVGGPDPKDGLRAATQTTEALSLLEAGQPARAREVLAATPETGGWVALARAEIELALDDGVAAEAAAREMVKLQPGYAEGYIVLGRALEMQGALDAARAAYEEAGRVDPTQTKSTVALGRLAESQARLDVAEMHYREALDARSPSAEAAVQLAALYFDSDRALDAETLLSGLGSTARVDPAAVIRLAYAEARAGNHERARRRLATAAKAHPRDASLKEAHEELAGASAP